MALVERSGEDEMIATFLVAGLGSHRATERHLRDVLAADGLDERLVTAPDLSDPTANRRRQTLLANWYGWGRQESLFGSLPSDDIDWWRGPINRDALPEVEVIQWLVDEYPDGFPARPLRRVAEHNRHRWRAGGPVAEIALAARAGVALPPPIVITTPARDRVVILDGHTRLCALMSTRDQCPPEVTVIVGVASRAAEWSEW